MCTYTVFMQKFEEMGSIVEAFVEGFSKQSPSVQYRVNPLEEIDIISTHNQLLGGESKQVFPGATFPARSENNSSDVSYNRKLLIGPNQSDTNLLLGKINVVVILIISVRIIFVLIKI